jgi:hypothetical protein
VGCGTTARSIRMIPCVVVVFVSGLIFDLLVHIDVTNSMTGVFGDELIGRTSHSYHAVDPPVVFGQQLLLLGLHLQN